MADRETRARMPDLDLDRALRDLAVELAVPSIADASAAAGTSAAGTLATVDGALDPARLARLRIEARGVPPVERRWWPVPLIHRPVGRGLVLALVAAVALAAVAGAIGLGLPGIRIVPAPTASASASASAMAGGASGSADTVTPGASVGPATSPSSTPVVVGPPGSGLKLGTPIRVAEAARAVDFPIALPTSRAIGSPVSAWLLDGRLSLVWPDGPDLPVTREPGVGAILSEFRGSLEPGYFQKILGPDTTLTTVALGGGTGYWISGAPHEIVFVDPSGMPVFDSRRIVGDTLLWASGGITYRLETALGLAAAVTLAESLH